MSKEDVQLCRTQGWAEGTVLVATEQLRGPPFEIAIELTRIASDCVYAKQLFEKGYRIVNPVEEPWCLTELTWRVVSLEALDALRRVNPGANPRPFG